MELLVAVGDMVGAERLVRVRSAHISGISYKTIGDAGIEFLGDFLADTRVRVPTSINPAGIDIERWRELGISPEFASRQRLILDAFRSIGALPLCTCTPYLAGHAPRTGEHVAWGESSATAYVNSVLGARTNRESAITSLMAALTGYTVYSGLHVRDNRAPTHRVRFTGPPLDEVDASALGFLVGSWVGDGVPYFEGVRVDLDGAKSVCAALGASGAVAMCHIDALTPEHTWARRRLSGLRTFTLTSRDVQAFREERYSGVVPDLVALGCPHLSENELARVVKTMERLFGDARPVGDIWLTTSRAVARRRNDLVARAERYARVVCDTCMVVAPLEPMYRSVGVNSAKAFMYLGRDDFFTGDVVLDSMEGLLRRLVP